MNTPKIFKDIASSRPAKFITKKASQAANSIGSGINNILEKSPEKDTFAKKALKAFEPTGSNNSFIGLASIMLGAVVAPRVITAAKRNPDNKEATKDEIMEILFRDLQTIAIILFALKSMNTVIANAATKKNGIPMVNKPFEKLFNSTEKGLEGFKAKAQEFKAEPGKKFKIIGRNILNTFHPTGGSVALTGEEYLSRYSGYDNIDDIIKLIDDVPNLGGDKEKVFNKIVDSLIEQQNKTITDLRSLARRSADSTGAMTSENKINLENAEAKLESLKEVKEKGYENFRKVYNQLPEVRDLFIGFFEDKDNALVTDAKKLDSVLRTIALGIESTYLGFGLPALNQKRLEKKYLNKNSDELNTAQSAANSNINNRHIKAQEIKLYSNFLNK